MSSFPFPTGSSIPGIELADSQGKYRIVVLLADISASMKEAAPNGGTRIQALNGALERWVPSVQREGSGNLRNVEFAVITFGLGGVQIVSGDPSQPPNEDGGAFVKAADFRMGPFSAGGYTPMVEAINQGISLAQGRQRYLRDNYNITTGQPRLIMFSDGRPTDEKGRWTQAWLPIADRLRALRSQRRLYFLAFGVPGVDKELMSQLAPEGGFYELHEIDFETLLIYILMATTADDPYMTLNERFRRR